MEAYGTDQQGQPGPLTALTQYTVTGPLTPQIPDFGGADCDRSGAGQRVDDDVRRADQRSDRAGDDGHAGDRVGLRLPGCDVHGCPGNDERPAGDDYDQRGTGRGI